MEGYCMKCKSKKEMVEAKNKTDKELLEIYRIGKKALRAIRNCPRL